MMRVLNARGLRALSILLSGVFVLAGATRSDLIWAQRRATPAQLQDALVSRLIGQRPSDAQVKFPVGRVELPGRYAELNLLPGQFAAVDGVTIEIKPPIRNWSVILAGVPRRFQANLQDLGNVLRKNNWDLTRRIASDLADYYCENSPTQRDALSQLYSRMITEATEIQKESQTGTNRERTRSELAKLLADGVLREFQIFAKAEPQARARRYRFWKGKPIPVSQEEAVRHLLVRAFQDFLEGGYLARDRRRIATGETADTVSLQAANDPRVNPFAYPFAHHWRGQGSIPKLPPAAGVGHSGTYCWEARVFTAEHPIIWDPTERQLNRLTGWVWKHVALDVGLVHTSVVGGIWRVKVTNGAAPGAASPVDLRQGTFVRWIIADGSASWIFPRDLLTLKLMGDFSSYDAAAKWLLTTAEESTFDRTKACAYSVGNYGGNWVCHQNSNAYSYMKWKKIIVLLPTNWVFRSMGNYWSLLTGSLPVSTANDPFYPIRHQNGGVPGEWLFYQLMWPYATYGPALVPLMNGGGYGLQVAWSRSLYAFEPSNCSFIQRSIPLRPLADPPTVVH